jgi:trehalose 6-phosphate phosphatase
MLADVEAALGQRPPDSTLILLFDFDGTLAEFDLDPAAPVLTPERREWLTAVANGSGVSLGVVSGRRLDDLKRRTRLAPSVYHSGLHGLEIEIDNRRWQHPELGEAHRHIRELAVHLMQLADRLPGSFVEDKSASVAFHVRRIAPDKRGEMILTAQREATAWIETGRVRPLLGDAVIEFLPNIRSHKGDALKWIVADVEARTHCRSWVAFVGDDVTDEDAFRAIESGIGVLVGLRPTAATHQLGSIAEVDRLLRHLASRE